jgi:putative nucleotidyltransferase with HDIG domain
MGSVGRFRLWKGWLLRLRHAFSPRLQLRITLPFVLLTLLVAGVGTFVGVREATSSMQDRLVSYAGDAVSIACEGMAEAQRRELAALRAMAYTEGVAEAIERADRERLTALLVPLKMNYGSQRVVVVDARGREVLGIHHRPASRSVEDFNLSEGADLSIWPMVERILSGQVDEQGDKHAEIRAGPSGYSLWIGGAVPGVSGSVGAILIGTYLDSLAADLALKSLSRVTLYDTQGNVLATTLSDDHDRLTLDGRTLDEIDQAPGRAILRPMFWEEREYMAGHVPLMVRGANLGVLAAAVSTEYVAEAGSRTRWMLVALFTALGVGIAALGHAVAGRIAAPVRALVTASRRIGAGDFSQRLADDGRDEIAELARAFNYMSGELERHTAELSRKVGELTILYETSAHLNKTLDLAGILQTAVDAVYRTGEADVAALLLRRDADDSWFWAASRGLFPDQEQRMLSQPMAGMPAELHAAMAHGGASRPVILRHSDAAHALNTQIVSGLEMASWMAIPLTSTGHTIGLVLLGSAEASSFPDEMQVRLLETISTEVAWSIHNAQLYAQVSEKVDQLATLQQISGAISAKLSRDDLLGQILREVSQVARARRVVISLWNAAEERLEPGVCYSETDGMVVADEADAHGRKLAERVVHERRPLGDGAGDEPGVRYCVPIWAENDIVGTILVESDSEADGYSRDDVVVLTTVANQAGVALKNALLYEDIQKLYQNVVKSLATAIDARDPYTHGHSHRVSANSLAVARYLGLSPAMQEACEIAGYLHDVGKIGVPDAVLLKKGPLIEGERRTVEEHPEVGARILRPVGFGAEVIDIVITHHERPDGRGYPAGLQGDAIPLGGRILAVVDSFDAMMSDRPYRDALALETTLAELRRHAGAQFDRAVVTAFLDALQAGAIALPERDAPGHTTLYGPGGTAQSRGVPV